MEWDRALIEQEFARSWRGRVQLLTHQYDAESARRFRAEGFWDDEPIWSVVASHPSDRVAVIDGARQWTWGEVRRMSENAAVLLRGRGIRRGDVVAVQLPNCVHLVVTVLALVRLGAVYHPLNPAYRQHDLKHIFGTSHPKLFVHPQQFHSFDYGRMAATLDTDLDTLVVNLDEVPSAEPATGELTDTGSLDPDDVFLVGATSGSTGIPKLFVHTQNTQKNEARVLCEALGIDAHSRFLATAPLTHRGALMFGLMTTIVTGASIVLASKYRPSEVLDLIDQHQVTAMMGIPTQITDLVALIEERGGTSGTSLSTILISGAPIPPGLVTKLKELLPGCAPVTGYGTSETGYSTFTRPSDELARLQTCGRPTPGMEIRIADDSEILIRGPFVFSGYVPGAGNDSLGVDENGWFHTGDLGALDQDDFLHVTGRLKNVIIRSGLKIQVEEIEILLSTHPDIDQCVLVPVPDARLGEKATVVVLPRDESRLALSDVTAFLEEHGVAKFKWPEAIVNVTVLPTTSVGKLDRRALRDRVVDGQGS